MLLLMTPFLVIFSMIAIAYLVIKDSDIDDTDNVDWGGSTDRIITDVFINKGFYQ